MDAGRARFVVSDMARDAIEALPPQAADLPLHQLANLLRQSFDAGAAAAVSEQVALRARAAERFGFVPLQCYTASGLEMMTHPAVAHRRAARLRELALPVADLTCGIGGDLTALAGAGIDAVALERDPATAIIATANVPRANVARGDARRPPFRLAGRAVLLDPARRDGASRRWDPAAFQPDWDAALMAAQDGAAGVVKSPPGIDHGHVPAQAELEFVQLGRSLREATLWFGVGSMPGLRRAVLLPAGCELRSTDDEAPASPAPLGAWIFDPESCVTRAGLVRQLAAAVGARMLDERIAFLTAEAPSTHPLCATFEVLDALPFSVSRLRERLRQTGRAPREIRRRAFPIEPDELRRLLGRLEGEPVTLICTTIAGRRTTLIARPLNDSGAASFEPGAWTRQRQTPEQDAPATSQ
jgi:hypothetical protein